MAGHQAKRARWAAGQRLAAASGYDRLPRPHGHSLPLLYDTGHSAECTAGSPAATMGVISAYQLAPRPAHPSVAWPATHTRPPIRAHLATPTCELKSAQHAAHGMQHTPHSAPTHPPTLVRALVQPIQPLADVVRKPQAQAAGVRGRGRQQRRVELQHHLQQQCAAGRKARRGAAGGGPQRGGG